MAHARSLTRCSVLRALELHSSGHFAHMPEHRMARARPADYLLIWVLAGTGFARARAGTVQACGGDLLLFEKGRPHAYGTHSQDPWDIVWVHFDGPAAAEFVARLCRHGRLRLDLGLDDHLRNRFLELVMLHGLRAGHLQLLCDSLLWGLLAQILHTLELRRQAGGPHRLAQLQRLQDLVERRLDGRLVMDDLAAAANLSPRQLSRLFQQAFKVSPMRYVIQQRMARAALLLRETSWAVKQVAGRVGCADPYYFSRLFRQATGLSPLMYRRRQRPADEQESSRG